MSTFWIAVIGSSALAFATKFLGASVPQSALSHPRALRINNLVPIALLTALVAVNTFGDKSRLATPLRHGGSGYGVTG